MKYILALILSLLLLLSTGCTAKNPSTATESSTDGPERAQESSSFLQEEEEIPQELLGVWVSADEGEREMTESITFYENGSIVVELTYQKDYYGTLYGTFTVDGHYIYCDITEGTTPYQVTYGYRIDGRELYLSDDDGEAQYLRTS